MTVEAALALIGFAFVTSASPGPGNFLLLASGANFGFIRSLPLLLGVSAGVLSVIFFVGLGLGEILQQNPLLYNLLRVICGIYVIWLAIRIGRSRSLGSNDENQMSRPIGFIQAVLLQWLNPKAWTASLIVTVAYATAENYLMNLVLLVAVFAVVNIPSISLWAWSGAALQNWLGSGKKLVFFNYAMAVLLVGSIIPMLIIGV